MSGGEGWVGVRGGGGGWDEVEGGCSLAATETVCNPEALINAVFSSCVTS